MQNDLELDRDGWANLSPPPSKKKVVKLPPLKIVIMARIRLGFMY